MNQFTVKKPYANKIVEAINKGHAYVKDPGQVRVLGRIGSATGGLLISRQNSKTYPDAPNIITPKNIKLIEELTDRMVFEVNGGTKNGRKRKEKERYY